MNKAYTSGIATLKELANTMQGKASSDLEHVDATFSSQTMAVENFLASAAFEAKEVIEDIKNLLNEQKQMLALSAQQREEGFKRSLTSSEVISKATMNFFNDLHCQASKVITTLQESQIKKIHQLADFEKMFKEEAGREEKQALENIAEILAALTSRKTVMVSKASRNIQDLSILENMRFQREISSMQQVSTHAKEEISRYVEPVERNFIEDTFSVAESRVVTENIFQKCSKRVEYSCQQWENAQSYIKNLNKSSVLEIESTMKENISANHGAHEEFLSASSAMDAEFDSNTCEVMAAVNDSLMRDRESKKEIESISTLCLDQLKAIQQNHGQRISNIRSNAEKCLTKDYLVDQDTESTPKRRVIQVPSLASSEEMRTSACANIKEENKRSKWGQTKSKIPMLQAASPNRAPFVDVN